MNIEAKVFWDWFVSHVDIFSRIDDVDDVKRDYYLEELLVMIQKYNRGLYFQICNDDINELIITAEGDSSRFNEAIELVSKAPDILDWKFIALKQPHSTDFVHQASNVCINVNEMWFLPLRNEKIKGLGLEFYTDSYSEPYRDDFLNATYEIAEHIIGEEKMANIVEYINIKKTPLNPDSINLIKINELNQYIDWWMTRQ